MREDGNESMHFAVELNFLRDVAPHGLERAPKIVDGKSRGSRNQPIRDSRGQLAVDQGILAILPPAMDEIVSFIQFAQQQRNIRGIALRSARGRA